MRLPVAFRFFLCVTGLGVAFVALGRALIWIPLLVLDGRTLLCVILGVMPIPILSAQNRRKYISAVLAISGSGGLLQMIVYDLGCVVPVGTCSSGETLGRTITASACYIVFSIGGWWWLQELTAKQPR